MNHSVRVAVFSDIHSNLPALEACIADSRGLGAQEYVVLGDIVSDWHKPNECVETVRNLTPLVIKGNRERYLKDAAVYMDLWEIYDQFASLLWTYQTLTPDNLTYLSQLPSVLTLNGASVQIRAVHGSPFRINEQMNRDSGEGRLVRALNAIEEDILLFGHTHEQWKYEFQGKLAVNPGSVGLHRNQERRAEYVLLEITDHHVNVTFRQVPYDLETTFTEMMRTDLYQKSYAWTLVNYLGMRKGTDELKGFLERIAEERRKNEFSAGGPIPNDIFYKIFDEYYANEITELITGFSGT